MFDLRLDLRDAWRSLRKSRALMLSAVTTLALGIGMTTSIFSVVNGVVLRPLPFPNEGRLVTLCEQYPSATPDWCSISPPNVEDIAARSRAIEAIGIGRQWSYSLALPNGVEMIESGLASPGLFRAVGARVQAGRLIEPADLIGGHSDVVLLTHETWQARFGGRRDVVGQVVTLDQLPVTIIGVLEPGFDMPRIGRVEIWRPLHIDPKDERHREWRGFIAYGLLRRGVSIDVARRELNDLAVSLRTDHFASTPNWGITMVSLRDLVIGSARPMLFIFLGGVGLVLLICCANVGNLLLTRSTVRAREMGMRATLGATPARIIRQVLLESLVLALVGGAGGIALAVGATRAFKALAPPGIPRVGDVSMDARVLAFAVGVSILTTLVFGLAPALRSSRMNLSQMLREGGRTSAARSGGLGRILVVTELALAALLIASGGMLTRSFIGLTAWQPGFEREHLLTFSVFAPSGSYRDRQELAALIRRLESEVAAIPGVTSVATASAGPLFGGRETWEMEVDNRGETARASIRWFDASPSYFATFGVPIVRGRPLAETDVGRDQLVGVVNEALVRRLWPMTDPIGRTLTFGMGNDRGVFRVVGVAKDIPPLESDRPVEPQLYWSNRQLPRPFTYVILRTAVPPATLASTIRERVRLVDRSLEARSIAPFASHMDRQLTTPRFTMLLVASFGFAALVLAAIGIYGLLNYVTARRSREIAIRLALGARRRQVVGSVLGSGISLAAIGIGVGLVATALTGRFLRAQLVGVSTLDPLAIAGAAVVLFGVATVACAIPAWRASRVDPGMTLTSE